MIVLDASALLALIKGEEGADVVARAAGSDDATISAVNYTETLQKAARAGVPVEDVDVALEGLGITVSPFGRLDARLTASFTGTDRGSASPIASAWPWLEACRASRSRQIKRGSTGRTTSASPSASFAEPARCPGQGWLRPGVSEA